VGEEVDANIDIGCDLFDSNLNFSLSHRTIVNYAALTKYLIISLNVESLFTLEVTSVNVIKEQTEA
jgi:hypothetical protein